jgi:hypothetical protein
MPSADNPEPFNDLRSKYRTLWDAYQVIAHKNSQLLKSGKQPPDDQVSQEREAATAVEKARDALLAAISRLGR